MSAKTAIADKNKKVRYLVYIQDWARALPDPADAICEDTFYQRSCARWAAWEALKAVKESDKKPIIALEELIKTMDSYSTQDSAHAHMFSIAYDTLMALYDEIFLI